MKLHLVAHYEYGAPHWQCVLGGVDTQNLHALNGLARQVLNRQAMRLCFQVALRRHGPDVALAACLDAKVGTKGPKTLRTPNERPALAGVWNNSCNGTWDLL